ncbi:hypothetical protein F66182_10279 [Fusarium sp. NRRL 66182]|nr:hypothetical protein F66182_10279 [Fusarium sp. NRRL 66182]
MATTTTSTAETRPRPVIEPIRTSGPGLNIRSLRTHIAQMSPWSASPLSPRSHFLPRLQEMRDGDMEQHDRSEVDQLEPRKHDLPKLEPDLRNVSLRPIAELALPSPSTLSSARRSPLSAPLIPPAIYRRPTLAEETRNMLLRDPEVERAGPSVRGYERRQSSPCGVSHARAMQLARQREHLRRRGLVGSYRSREPEILVLPVELRRLSQISSSDADPPSPYPVDGRLTTRVVVHSHGRKPLILTRTFDLDELRATLPATSAAEYTEESRRASVATLQPVPNVPRSSSPGFSSERRHSHGALPRIDHSRSPSSDRRAPRQGLQPVAIRKSHTLYTPANSHDQHHCSAKNLYTELGCIDLSLDLNYARKYLPVLAAIILSEIVGPGDTVELPLPHPRAWEDTVAYVYTARVALTEPIRQNISYLGGSV